MFKNPVPKWRQASFVLIVTTVVLFIPNLSRFFG